MKQTVAVGPIEVVDETTEGGVVVLTTRGAYVVSEIQTNLDEEVTVITLLPS